MIRRKRCTEPGCPNVGWRRGYCGRHFQKHEAKGDLPVKLSKGGVKPDPVAKARVRRMHNEGHSLDEIAAALNISRDAAQKRIERAGLANRKADANRVFPGDQALLRHWIDQWGIPVPNQEVA